MATVSVTPAKLNYKMLRGDDFSDVVTIKEGDPPAAVDVSGRTYKAQVRRSPGGDVIAEMSIDMTAAASGEVGYAIADSITATLRGDYVWDFQQTVAGVIRTLMAGKFVVLLDVTRP